MSRVHVAVLLSVLTMLSSCSQKEERTTLPPIESIDEVIQEQEAYAPYGPTKLSSYGFFKGDLKTLTPAQNVLPYTLNAPLFSDYAEKKRFISIPSGEQIDYKTGEVLSFPIGTTLIKNFFYTSEQTGQTEDRIIETRLLIHKDDGWQALSYIWNKAQTEAYLEIAGGDVRVSLINKPAFNYSIPNINQCKSCHDKSGKLVPLGPSVRQLNRSFRYQNGNTNQLQMWSGLGWFATLPDQQRWPAMSDYTSNEHTLEDRARAYLDVNCAHCHNAEGPAKNSGLNLSIFEQDRFKIGVNKRPVAAGRGTGELSHNIVPGAPEKSILVRRMEIDDPGTKMPELGRTLLHEEGVALIRNWISEMSP